MTGAWVKRSGEERGEDEVKEGVPAAGLDQDSVENNLNKDVEEVNLGDIHRVNHHWAEGVEENLKGAKECLPKDGVEKDNFQCGREVDVEAVNAQDLWCVKWYGRKEAEYGMPIGRLAKMASIRLANGERKARLWEISWIARKQFWLHVAPIM